MTPLAFFSILAAVLVAADPTLRPSTPPTQRPTTSSTPQPTDLIRILEQDVQSAPFDLPSNTCAAFQVSFEGGSDRKFRVEITDSERGLNYVAAGLAYYNKNEVFSDPFTLPAHGVPERGAGGLRSGTGVRYTSYGANRPAGERWLRPRRQLGHRDAGRAGHRSSARRLCAARRAEFGVDLEQGYAGAAGEPI